jgi:hypothetical protein
VGEVVDRGRNAHRPIVEGLPERYRPHVTKLLDEFVQGDLVRRAKKNGRRAEARFLRRLLRMAVQREAVVTIVYRQDRLASDVDSQLLRQTLVKIWDDEVFHEKYFLAVQHSVVRPAAERIAGWIGGRATSLLADPRTDRLRRSAALLVKIAGRMTGQLSKTAAEGMGPLPPAEYCAHNVGLELTASLAYDVMAALLHRQVGGSLVKLPPERLALKVQEISGQELHHARVLADLCRLAEDGPDEELLGRIQAATRLARRPGQWPGHSRLGAILAVQKELSSNRWPAINDRASELLNIFKPSLAEQLRSSKTPIVCVKCDLSLLRPALPRIESGLEPGWSVLLAVLRWLAEFYRQQDVHAQLYVAGTPRRGQGLSRLYLEDIRDLLGVRWPFDARHWLLDRRVMSLSQRGHRFADTVPLTSYGSLFSSDPDNLHRVWDLWAVNATLRVVVATGPAGESGRPFGLEALDGLATTNVDALLGDLGSPNLTWFDVPRLDELAVLRMLGQCPPDLAVLRGHERGRGADFLLAGTDVLEVDRRAAALAGLDLKARNAYWIAELASQ